MTGSVLFIGGPGNISRSTASALTSDGWDVTVLTHPKDSVLDLDVHFLWGDRDDVATLQAVTRDVKPDVVVDTCAYTTRQVSQAIDVVAAPTRQYVFVSTVDVFGYPLARLPMRETDEHRDPNTPYAAAKRDCERLVTEAATQGRLTTTIVRPGYSIGPRFLIGFFSHLGGRTMLRRLRAGLPIVVPGDGTTTIQPGTGTDTGLLLARVVGESRAYGGVFTCAGSEVMTHDDYVAAMAEAVGVDPLLVHIPSEFMLAMGDTEIDQGILPGLTRYALAFSNDRIEQLAGELRPSLSLVEAIRGHLAWLDTHGWPETQDGPDDRLLQRFDRARAAFLEPPSPPVPPSSP